jgi:N-acetylglutamate synthase-like GNAT family acetyltransferase
MTDFTVRPVDVRDRNWVAEFLDKHWGSTRLVSRGQAYLAHLLPGFVAEQDGEQVGLLVYRIDGDQCEIMSLDSVHEGSGVGTALINAMKEEAKAQGCKRLWLITTNDNLNALRFYQKRGFILAALYPNAVEQTRKLKPQIPLVGMDGIPIRDEIELEFKL